MGRGLCVSGRLPAAAPGEHEEREGQELLHNDRMVTTVDARGLACPLPLALAKARMAQVAPGERLVMLADDPEAPVDLGAWCAEEGHSLSQNGAEFTIVRTST